MIPNVLVILECKKGILATHLIFFDTLCQPMSHFLVSTLFYNSFDHPNISKALTILTFKEPTVTSISPSIVTLLLAYYCHLLTASNLDDSRPAPDPAPPPLVDLSPLVNRLNFK